MANRIYVWDRFIRIFHWTLVAAFVTAYVTGEEDTEVHFFAGYLIFALIVCRVPWGFVGSKHARFSNFVTSPWTGVDYLKGLLSGRAKHYIGHNPAGGWMMLLLLTSLALTVGSGVRAYGLEGHGPFAIQRLPKPNAGTMTADAIVSLQAERRARHAKEEYWEEIHEAAANATLFLVGLHVLGVVASSLRHRENLVRAMFTGYKSRSDYEEVDRPSSQ